MQSTATPAPTFTIGDRVIVFSFDTYVDDRMRGTVIDLGCPRHGDTISVRTDDGHTYRVDPRRVAPVPTCDTCHLGCNCSFRNANDGCGHHGCWGPKATNDCPGVAAQAARFAAARHVRAFAIGAVR